MKRPENISLISTQNEISEYLEITQIYTHTYSHTHTDITHTHVYHHPVPCFELCMQRL